MKRLIDYHLKQWKTDPYRKPLIVRGARQVGKTHTIGELGQQFESFVEVNFEKNPSAKPFFEKDLDPKKIIRDLSLLTQKDIVPGKTLLFLDEIQEMPRALTSLRYFYEEMPKLHVIAAGSLLDFAIAQVGVPVGRVSFLYLYPLSFMEYLVALGRAKLVESLLNHNNKTEFALPLHDQLLEHVFEYIALGGMPEVVGRWLKTQNPKKCFEIHHDIVGTYKQDFNKYTKKLQIKYLDLLLRQIPLQLSKRFVYNRIEGDFKKRELAPCLDLLTTANIAHKIFHTGGNGIPLGGEVNLNKFKVILADIALTQAILGDDLSKWFISAFQQYTNKGSLVEAFVGQEILAYARPQISTPLYYWHRESKSSQAEVDYVVQKEKDITPIEVKSGSGSTLKSLHSFLENHPQSPYGVRFSTHNYSVYQKIHSYPLYAIFHFLKEPGEDVSQLVL